MIDATTFREAASELRLLCSGARIQPGELKDPMFLIANYFFDSIAGDMYMFDARDGASVGTCSLWAHGTSRTPNLKSIEFVFDPVATQVAEYDACAAIATTSDLPSYVVSALIGSVTGPVYLPTTGLAVLQGLRACQNKVCCFFKVTACVFRFY